MTQRYDQTALCALSDALADAASVHTSAMKTADDPALAADLAEKAARLRQLSIAVRDCPDGDDEPGTALRLVDQLRLLADRLTGDDDEAARTASREAKADVVALIDDHLRSPEISADVAAVFTDIRSRITHGRTSPGGDQGLRGLPD